MQQIRVEYRDIRRYIEIETPITFQKFGDAVLSNFNVKVSGKTTIEITDNDDFRILTVPALEHAVEKLSQNNGFFFKVKIAGANANTDIITSKTIEKWILTEAPEILSTYKNTEVVTEKYRKKLVSLLVSNMVRLWGYYPSREKKIALAKATIILFPVFKVLDSNADGIDLFYNGRTGWIVAGLKCIRRKQNIRMRNAEEEDSDEDENDNNAKEAVDELRTTVVNNDSLPRMHLLLKRSMKYRSKLMSDPSTDFLETFRYFFTHPNLILFDFHERFPQINENALFDIWPSFKGKIEEVLLHYDTQRTFATEWTDDVERILMFLKILPKQSGRSIVPSVSFQNASNKLIVFSQHNTLLIPVTENKQPYIIARGHDVSNIDHYVIVLEKQFITVPQTFDFIATFDLLLKLYGVFNLDYDQHLSILMRFFEHFVYKFPAENRQTTNGMLDLFTKLTLNIESPLA